MRVAGSGMRMARAAVCMARASVGVAGAAVMVVIDKVRPDFLLSNPTHWRAKIIRTTRHVDVDRRPRWIADIGDIDVVPVRSEIPSRHRRTR